MGIGAEAGYDSNVFYSETDPRSSAMVRVIPFLELTNAPRGGGIPTDVFFDLGASLTYREYLSDDQVIRDQRAYMPSVFGNLEYGSQQAVSFALGDGFSRTEDPPYLNHLDQGPYIRDVNQAMARLRWAPGGGRLASTLMYNNNLDYFETPALRAASSMAHIVTVDGSWKWLPKTAFVVQVSQGYTTYLYSGPTGKKPNSFPLHALAGLRGLITAKLALNVAVGYANAFFDISRPGPSGLRGHVSATAEANYRPTLLTTVGLGYRHDFQNAILGDYYYVDAVYLNIGQAVAGRLGFGFSARYESRSFQNIPLTDGTFISRHDNFWQVGANLDYHIRDWTYAGVAYTLMSNNSPYEPPTAMDPGRVNYVKHLVFARLGVTY
jgi:hypothetical protein